MATVFYVKTMDGKETILKQEVVPDLGYTKIDTFYLPHDVLVWGTLMVEIQPKPWDDFNQPYQGRAWYLYRHVKGIWAIKRPDEVPGILRMMELAGAL